MKQSSVPTAEPPVPPTIEPLPMPGPAREEQSFEAFIQFLRKRGLWILGATLIGLIAGFVANFVIKKQYTALFGALAEPAYLTYGNVDVPRLWDSFRKPGHQVLDGGRTEVGGVTFGFVGAGLISPYRTPNEVPPSAYAEKLDAVGAVENGEFVSTRVFNLA